MINNAIFVILGMIAIGAMITTSNMSLKKKRNTVVLLITLSVCFAIYFGITFYWFLAPMLLIGCLLGRWANYTMDKRRTKYLKLAMSDKSTSL